MDSSKIWSSILVAVVSAVVVAFVTFLTIGINNDAINIGEIPNYRGRIEILERDRENFKNSLDELNRITFNLYTANERQKIQIERNTADLQNIREVLIRKYLIPENAIGL